MSNSLPQRILILYGSQTGTAQDLAEEIWRQSQQFNLHGPVLAMDDYKIAQLIDETLVIFVCSTTGQGDEPDNMFNFWKFLLRKSLPNTSLVGLRFAVLGLGDSSYQKFNFVAKRLFKRLTQLSATPVTPLGLSDDQHDLGYSAVSINWIKKLWETLDFQPINEQTKGNSIQKRIHTKFSISLKQPESEEKVSEEFKWSNKRGKLTEFIVKKNYRTTSVNHFQDVRLISFDPGDVKWQPGDVFVVTPCNSDDNVEKLLNLLAHIESFQPETIVNFREHFKEMPLPVCYSQPLPLKTIVKYVWDLNAIPRQRVFELLSIYCTDELEKEKLLEFTTAEGLEDLYSYVNRPRRTVLEVLYDFPHAISTLDLPILFEMFQPMKSRSFSIASNYESGDLDILVAIVEYKTLLKDLRKGLCSNWLKNLTSGDIVQGEIRRGTFKIPKKLTDPLIMIAPGTGIAPFRSLLLEREYLNKIGHHIGELVLFFGCRNKEQDFHCREDLERLQTKEILKYFCAFSRDQEHKIYVQHLIEHQGDLLKKLLENDSSQILVAGSSKNMPNSVRESFQKIVGENLLEKMIKEKRYQEETWS